MFEIAGLAVTLGLAGAAGIVWLVRLEGRHNVIQALYNGLKERVDGLEDRIRLLKGDLFAPLGKAYYDLIISNPPYVDAEGMAELPDEYRHEPALALAGGDDGIAIVRRILREGGKHLNPGGGLLCEIGRCRPALEEAYPNLDFLWIDTEESAGEVFWLTREQLEK